ncbi:hypothetical protein [Dictyobacter aurantiacus]|uniref:Uncharacterized protein n=1 Tax=Dictyobacter aurantiacus TaxID=1936993 RepID=A0A401ZS44_9CHLR|nr:hypothetical protein [Dictyobacter aurantiacus]GCE09738.1 hypothetical protein KDAU_70670 [Dictyobacter aurantiacus]
MALIAHLYNRWHKQALEIAYEQRQSMPADYASEIEAEYKGLLAQRTQEKGWVGWKFKSVLIGLWPTIILFALPIVVSQLHWSKWILILGWALFGVLAIMQPFIRMVPAMTPLPTGAAGKKLLQEYTRLEMFDGISACAIAILLLFTTFINRPTSLIVLGIVAGAACLTIASTFFLRYQKIKNKAQKQSSTAKKQPQKAEANNIFQFSTILLTIRRMLVFYWIFAYIERVFEGSVQLLIIAYWFIFIAVIACGVLLMYDRQLTSKFPEAKEQAA